MFLQGTRSLILDKKTVTTILPQKRKKEKENIRETEIYMKMVFDDNHNKNNIITKQYARIYSTSK